MGPFGDAKRGPSARTGSSKGEPLGPMPDIPARALSARRPANHSAPMAHTGASDGRGHYGRVPAGPLEASSPFSAGCSHHCSLSAII
ncbi:hypothetical protein B0T26DRAFT_520372 [Lasiosphaeria miniovina]|uniref:Uncharacterized protein n=1 Tax=Lasiosphaeria miniovina TaxID=1954250 RepID=A0AA39ZUT7_9PEZI|nr:uncharacterized protein B0T26DRAFT_520372 [Lasiosphaeria miniovina]KAK0704003.1 hypothetical protein B0T26DRAFT_520372 [Lasiosphaeria miniovina]